MGSERDDRFDERDRAFFRDDRAEHGAVHGNLMGNAEHRVRDWFEGHADDHDEPYRRFRQRHIAEMDRDYDAWRQDRQHDFHREFDGWRAQRQQGQADEMPALELSDAVHATAPGTPVTAEQPPAANSPASRRRGSSGSTRGGTAAPTDAPQDR